MGLDMYLSKKTYVKNWEHNGRENQHRITIKRGGKPRTDIKPERITYIIEEVAYWRKFNALHGWFVDNCGDGVDDGGEYFVSREKIKELLGILKKVRTILNKSKKVNKKLADFDGATYSMKVYDCEDEICDLLPPTTGFFFGSSEIDDDYKNHVSYTIKTLQELLKEDKSDELYSGEFYYEASW